MVDEDRVLRLLRSITDDVSVLRRESEADTDRRRDPIWHAVLAPELALSMRKAVGFRNVLVHDYIEVNDEIVVDRLKALDDPDEFVRQVAAFVTSADT